MHCLMRPGDEFVASKKLYGGSINQFNHAFKNFGWNVVWADPDDIGTFERAITPKTKAIFIESIANPGGVITDIEAIAEIAKSAGVPLIVDNTLATPYLCKPIDYGADIVVHSLTKFLGGHGNSIGGHDRRRRHLQLVAREALSDAVASRGRNITASCCTRPSATSPSPSPAACWRCATSGRRCRRSTRSSSSPASRRCRCACSATATTPRR